LPSLLNMLQQRVKLPLIIIRRAPGVARDARPTTYMGFELVSSDDLVGTPWDVPGTGCRSEGRGPPGQSVLDLQVAWSCASVWVCSCLPALQCRPRNTAPWPHSPCTAPLHACSSTTDLRQTGCWPCSAFLAWSYSSLCVAEVNGRPCMSHGEQRGGRLARGNGAHATRCWHTATSMPPFGALCLGHPAASTAMRCPCLAGAPMRSSPPPPPAADQHLDYKRNGWHQGRLQAPHSVQR
jgi:hypothetical protein